MAKAKKRRARKRQVVKRSDRTPATPETMAKLQRDGLQDLLARESGGLDPADVEALLEIEHTFGIMERELGATGSWLGERSDGGGGYHELSDRAARLWAIWNIWATELYRRTKITGVWVAGIVQGRAQMDASTAKLLSTAASLWHNTKRNYDDAHRAEQRPRHTIAPTYQALERGPVGVSP